LLAGPEYVTLNDLVRNIAQVLRVKPPRLRLPLRPLRWGADICESLCPAIGIEPPLHHRRVDFFVKDRAFTAAKAERELGFQPRVDLLQGLEHTERWYRERGYL
jgi:nucleoside-diphosphate-sugar epimerase